MLRAAALTVICLCCGCLSLWLLLPVQAKEPAAKADPAKESVKEPAQEVKKAPAVADKAPVDKTPTNKLPAEQGPPAQAGFISPPRVRVKEVRKVFGDGTHNAFTDLCSFRGNFYLAFRNCPDGHGINATSKIVILTSFDTKTWKEAFSFSVPDRDTRDPHFAIMQDKLFVYTGTWFCKPAVPGRYDFNEHLGFAVTTENGRDWQGPIMLEGTYGHYIWRAAVSDLKIYLCGRRKHHFAATETREELDRLTESALLVSDDGLKFRQVGLFQEEFGNETAFVFDDQGDILAVARSGGGKNAQVCRAKRPFTEFTRTDLDRHIGGPMLARWNWWYVTGGRKVTKEGPVTALYWLIGDKLTDLAELPSDGDNSYPGFYMIDKQRAFVSYYSSHEDAPQDGKRPSSIYLAELETVSDE